MKNLNLQNLKENSKEILKAEVGALLFNLGKTHIGFWGKKKDEKRNCEITYFKLDNYFDNFFKKEYGYQVFTSYKNYFEKVSEDKCPFELDLEKAGENFKPLLMDTDIKIKLNGSKTKSSKNFKLINVINGDGEAYKDNFIEKVMLKGCENINSGIDKGSPKRQLDDFNLNIANAFGSIKERILDTDEGRSNYDKKRIDFLKDLGSKNFDFDRDLIEEIMEYIQCKVEEWYSHLLSDSRFPINDITLWDQAYMTSSMFKAALAAISLDGSMYDKYMNDPRKVKWSILGIQYDKLGLAEKAMNPHFIKWYREKTSKVDEEIKKLVEIDYALGNEIYRDETGIYFIAPENICGNHVKKNDETEKLYYLNDSLIELQNEIVKCFESFNGEIFPAVFLTKPSRGTMNIAYLLKNAKKNFLKPIYPKTADIEKLFKAESSEHFNKICDVCGIRLAEEEINGLKLCSICAERIRNQKNNLIDSNDEETVFTGEIQDKNGRIALVTLKFELDEWLNGNMLNLMLSNFECESVTIASIVSLFKNIRKTYSPFSSDNITTCLKKYKKFANNNSKEEVINVLQYFDKSFIISYKSVMNKMFEDGEYKLPKKNEEKVKYKRRKETFIYYIYKFLENEGINLKYVKNDKEIEMSFQEFIERCSINKNDWGNSPHTTAKGVFSFSFITEQIKNIILERTIGDEWEELLKSKLKNKIDFENRTIKWNELSDSNIEFLSEILLQFLIRKNPSPARFRRIWETTEEFFKELQSNLCNIFKMPEWRNKRIKFRNIVDEQYRNREFEYKALNFTPDANGNLYLISSVEQAVPLLKKNLMKNKTAYREIKEGQSDWLNNKKIELTDMDDNSKHSVALDNVEYITYKPYISIINSTPVSWQFIMPAEYVPKVIEKVEEKYNKDFKYVNGKLPLHMGIVFQDYKKPLYIGIKALRNIRRDIYNWDSIKDKKTGEELKESFDISEENKLNCKYYSLFQLNREINHEDDKIYRFYLPKQGEENIFLKDVDNASKNEEYYVYPNTIDFEFLDTNIRRNDINYNYEKGGSNAKRAIELKNNRPYTWGEWKNFQKFKKYFRNEEKVKDNEEKEKEKINNTKLQSMVSLIYSKLNDWKGNENQDGLVKFMLSAFVNVFELKDDEKKNEFAKILWASNWNDLKEKSSDEFKSLLYKFLDMYDFWHNCLKKI